MILIKSIFSFSQKLEWAQSLGGTGIETAQSIKILPNGKVVVVVSNWYG